MRTKKSYENWEKFLRILVSSWHETTGVEKKILMSVANEAYVSAKASFNPARAQFATWLRLNVNQNMMWYMKRNAKYFSRIEVRPSEEIENMDMPSNKAMDMPDAIVSFRDTILSMSNEAKEVASIILAGPLEIMGLEPEVPVRSVRRFIYKHLRDRGWLRKQIHGAFKEIMQALETGNR